MRPKCKHFQNLFTNPRSGGVAGADPESMVTGFLGSGNFWTTPFSRFGDALCP